MDLHGRPPSHWPRCADPRPGAEPPYQEYLASCGMRKALTLFQFSVILQLFITAAEVKLPWYRGIPEARNRGEDCL